MHVPEQFHRTNDWLCLALGCATNGTLLWLLANRTTQKMANYRPILQLSTITDLVYLSAHAGVMPVLLTDRGASMWLLLGPLRHLPPPWPLALIAGYVWCSGFSHFSLTVPFIFRYANICWKREWKLGHFLAMLPLPLALAFVNVAIQVKTGYIGTVEQQLNAREFFLNDSFVDGGDSPTIALFLRSPAPALYILGVFFFQYNTIFYCGWRIYRHLTLMAETHMAEAEYHALQLQLSSALLLQSIIPLVITFAPSIVTNLTIIAGMPVRFTVYKSAFNPWYPVVNPLIAIWVIKAYRRTVFNWLKHLRLSACGLTASVHPTPNTQQQIPMQQVTAATQNTQNV